MMNDLSRINQNGDFRIVHHIRGRHFCTIAVLIVIILCVCLTSIACALTIRIPQTVDPATLTIFFGTYEHGLGFSQLDTRSGVYNYDVDLRGARAKLVVYSPGFESIFMEFPKGYESKVFEPSFKRIPMVSVRIRLTYKDGKPIANKPVQIRLQLCSYEYFGFSNSPSYAADIVSTVTDSNGEFVARIPSVLDDPCIMKYNNGIVGFDVWLQVPPSNIDHKLIPPRRLTAKRSYKGTVSIQFFRWASLHGQIRQSFLKRNNIKPNEKVMLMARRDAQGSGATRDTDGSLKMSIEPGTYDLVVLLQDKGHFREIPVLNSIPINEDEDRFIDIE